MRILIDYRPALRQRTGVGEYVHELARALWPRRAGDRRVDASTRLLELVEGPAARPAPTWPGAGRSSTAACPVRVLNLAWHRLGWPPVEWLAGRASTSSHSPTRC